MIKLNQPLTITLEVNDLASASSAAIEYRKPDGTTGTWSSATIDVPAGTISYDIPEDILDVRGTWEVIAVITFSDKVIPGTAHEFSVHNRYA